MTIKIDKFEITEIFARLHKASVEFDFPTSFSIEEASYLLNELEKHDLSSKYKLSSENASFITMLEFIRNVELHFKKEIASSMLWVEYDRKNRMDSLKMFIFLESTLRSEVKEYLDNDLKLNKILSYEYSSPNIYEWEKDIQTIWNFINKFEVIKNQSYPLEFIPIESEYFEMIKDFKKYQIFRNWSSHANSIFQYKEIKKEFEDILLEKDIATMKIELKKGFDKTREWYSKSFDLSNDFYNDIWVVLQNII